MNLLYFGRMWEQTGVYIVLFRKFINNVTNFIILILALAFIAADIFYILGSLSTQNDEETGTHKHGVFPTFYDAVKASMFFGILGQNDITMLMDHDS